MKFYRVESRSDDDSHLGYQFFTTWREAIIAAGDPAEVEVVDIVPNKLGILQALNVYGGHPDNG